MEGNFFWGAATSAHQVEGGNKNDWTEWENENAGLLAKAAGSRSWPDYVLRNYPDPRQEKNYVSGGACGHYNRFEEDFDIAKGLGHNAHRFSIEWSRIEPEEGEFNEKEMEHYRKVIAALRERGLEPFLTLWHFTLPAWLAKKGGVLNKKFSGYFAAYAEKIAEEFGSGVSFWITVNEPEIYASNSFFLGKWPPNRKNIFACSRAFSNILKAHNLAYAAIKKISPQANIGASFHLVFFESAGGPINGLLKFLADKIWNFYAIGKIKNNLDFLGVNYYFHKRLGGFLNKNGGAAVSDTGREIYPEGIYRLLLDLKKYRKPIYITENGVADARDALRAQFIKNHVANMKKAMGEGVRVRGYFYWSLLDNFEWDKGFWPRFGLVEVDYKTMARKIRPSAFEYKKLIDGFKKVVGR